MYTPIPLSKSEKTGIGYWEGFSPKLRRDVTLLGDLEYEHWILVEANPEIITYCERPLKISSIYKGKLAHAIPSIWVKCRDNTESLIKVKYLEAIPSMKTKFEKELEIEKEWCLDRKISHRVITNHEIRKNPILISNNKLIISLVSNRLYPIDTDLYCLNQFISQKKIKVSQLRNLMSETIPQTRIMEAVSWLIFKGEIRSTIEKVPMGPDLEVWRRE